MDTDDEAVYSAFYAEVEANARLIAASPALLEALEGACDVLESIAGQVEGASFALTEARAAIALARGGEIPTPSNAGGGNG